MADTEDQAHLPGTDYAKVKFVGMAWELVDVPQLRDEITFKVTGTVVAIGEEVMKDDVRKIAKVKVTSVVEA
jgi:hypothetical protein